MIILAVLVSVVVTVLCVVLFIATIGPVKRRFRIVRTASPSLSHQAAAGITLRDEVDELAQFLAAWQRVTVDRLSGRVEQSEVLDAGLLAHVAELLDAERIVVSLLDPSGLRIVDGHPGIEESVVVGDSPSRRAVHSGQIFIGDLHSESWGQDTIAFRDRTATGPVMAIPMVSGGESIGAVMVLRSAGEIQFTRVEFGPGANSRSTTRRCRASQQPVGSAAQRQHRRRRGAHAPVHQPAHAAGVRQVKGSMASMLTVDARS